MSLRESLRLCVSWELREEMSLSENSENSENSEFSELSENSEDLEPLRPLALSREWVFLRDYGMVITCDSHDPWITKSSQILNHYFL